MATEYLARDEIAPVERPVQVERPQLGVGIELVEVDKLIQAARARHAFKVSGSGLTVAVLDTGLRTTHVDFADRVTTQVNFTDDNGGDKGDASDGNGHGTNVGGIIVADGDHLGIAPGANIIPLKVLANNGGGSFASIRDALQWVIDHNDKHLISAVCMSLGDSGNYLRDTEFPGDGIQSRMRELRKRDVAVAVAAGNDYFTHDSRQGMGYPAIFRETVSVGAVYDEDEGSFSYNSGAAAFTTAADRITPFSQRLHESVNLHTHTDIFGPGAPVTSSGIQNDHGESTQHGTSQATPVVTGVILLLQEYYRNATGELPTVDDLVTWLRQSAAVIHDGDDENDNVNHTNVDFRRVDALAALRLVRRQLEIRVLNVGGPL